MYSQAKYAYRTIVEFVKHVTTHYAAHLEKNPLPQFHIPPADDADPAIEDGRRSRNFQARAPCAASRGD